LLYYIKMSSEWKHNSTPEAKNDWNDDYNNALRKALTAFYKKLKITQPGFYDHTRFDPYVEKIVEKRGAGTGDKDNIHALYEGLKKKYTQDYPSTIADALKSIAKFACTYANECSLTMTYSDFDALTKSGRYSLWAQPIPEAVMIINGVDTPITHELWNQLLGLIYLEFRSTLQKPGDVLYWYGKESVNRQGSFRSSSSAPDVGKEGWFSYIFPQGSEVQNTTNATYPYGREDIVSNFFHAGKPIPLQVCTKITLEEKYMKPKEQVQPLNSWFDGRQGMVEFFEVNDYNELESRFVEWWRLGRSAIHKTLHKIFQNVTNENVLNGLRQHIENCFVGPTLSQTRVTQGAGFTTHPFLLVLYSNLGGQQARAIKSAFPISTPLGAETARTMVRGHVTTWLTNIGQLLQNCVGFNADDTCGNPLKPDTGACPCFKKNGTTWDLDPRLKFTDAERAEGGWLDYVTSFVWTKPVKGIDQNAMCNPGIWMFIDLPSMPHSLIIIIRNGAIFSIGVGVDDSDQHPGSGGCGPGIPGTLGELLIHSPDDSILGNFKINTNKQFEGILSGEFTKKQRIRAIGYYNTTIQNNLQQTLDDATTRGAIAGTKAVTLTMSSKFGTYRTLSSRNWILWFFTGGVNCTSFAEWLSGGRGTTCGMSNPTQMTQTYATSVNPSNIPVDYRSTVPYGNQMTLGDGGNNDDDMDVDSGGGGSPKKRKYKHKKRRKQKTKRRRKRKTKRKRRGKKRKTRIKRKARIKKKTRRRR
jgi:hypothetical protein